MPSYPATILADPNLIAYWQLNELAGATIARDSKGLLHGAYNGGITLNQANVGPSMGGSALFDGVTGYVECPAPVSLQFSPAAPLSVEGWAFLNATSLAEYGLYTWSMVGAVSTGSNSQGQFLIEYGLNINQYTYPMDLHWHYLVFTFDGKKVRNYLDGVLTQTTNQPSGLNTVADPFFMGGMKPSYVTGSPYNPWLKGRISNVAIYGAALSQAQITAHYNAASTPASGNARVSQLLGEVARGQMGGAVRVSKLLVEVLAPFSAGSTNTFPASASASIVFSAAATAGKALAAKTASAQIIFSAVSNGFHGLYKLAEATIVFSAQAVLTNLSKGVQAAATIIFRARASNKVRPIVFGDDYLGRFQIGQDLPLWCVVRDQHGSLALPTTHPPVADIYNLDTGTHVETVEVARLRGSRVESVYAMPHLLNFPYQVGRHAIMYRATAGGFTGTSLTIFEIVPGGDPSGPVIALHTFHAAGGDQTLGQLGSGALAKGSRPRLG